MYTAVILMCMPLPELLPQHCSPIISTIVHETNEACRLEILDAMNSGLYDTIVMNGNLMNPRDWYCIDWHGENI